MNKSLILINAINHQRPTPPHIIDALIRHLLHPRCFNHYIKSMRILLSQLLPLRPWIFTIQLDVLIRRIQILCDVHLDSLVCDNYDSRGAIELKELCEDEPCWASTEEEGFDPYSWVELVQPMDSTRGRFKECRFFIGEIADFE